MKIIRPVFCGFALVLILVGAAYAQQAAPAAPPVPAAPAVSVPAAAPAAPGVQSVVKKATPKKKSDDDGEKEEKYYDTSVDDVMGLGPFVIGPKIQLGLPVPVGFGLEGRITNLIGFSFDYQFFPTIKINTVTVGLNSYDGSLRIFPWERAFFLGVSGGLQTLSGNTTKSIVGIDTKIEVVVKTYYVTPHIGWRWTWTNGFFMGMEIGAQIAAKADTTLTITINNPNAALVTATADYLKAEKDVKDMGNMVGSWPLPHFSFLQIGWYL
ncbi:MAG: hypothetical protein A2583_09405 [Bdellovibrionales bacterium RIFOXYD1_FULL_53_11]|nr:MAG: hypothetical protein A2583_09405 [Bdellovibrionales bacterium RIFOXYD1_FULL_53_11]